MFGYVIPELLIITLIMLNEIKLKLLGLYWQTELEVESVNEGIQRTICRGDEEEVDRKRKEDANMDLQRFYGSAYEQKKDLELYEKEMKKQYLEELERKSLQKK